MIGGFVAVLEAEGMTEFMHDREEAVAAEVLRRAEDEKILRGP